MATILPFEEPVDKESRDSLYSMHEQAFAIPRISLSSLAKRNRNGRWGQNNQVVAVLAPIVPRKWRQGLRY